MEDDDEGGCGQNYAIKKRRLTWMKYIDDGDHSGENFDDLACKHSCSFCENWCSKFLIPSFPYHFISRFLNFFTDSLTINPSGKI